MPKNLLQDFLVLRCRLGRLLALVALDRLNEFRRSGVTDQLAQCGDAVQEMRDFVQRAEHAETLKGCDGNGHLGLVIIVGIVPGVPGVQLLRQLLVRVGLDRKRLVVA